MLRGRRRLFVNTIQGRGLVGDEKGVTLSRIPEKKKMHVFGCCMYPANDFYVISSRAESETGENALASSRPRPRDQKNRGFSVLDSSHGLLFPRPLTLILPRFPETHA